MSRDRRKALVRSDYGRLGVARQCELVGISRSTHYYTAKGENELNLGLMRRWISYYNPDRPHSSLLDKTPMEAYNFPELCRRIRIKAA